MRLDFYYWAAMCPLQVPYAIPRDARKAFLTCVYLSDEAFDYKTTPLNALEAYLGERYESALVISDETGVFPNGDLTFFLLRGIKTWAWWLGKGRTVRCICWKNNSVHELSCGMPPQRREHTAFS